jgi:ubiquinone/menaquinone biosynthesis C-methylase UbiE
MNNEIFKKFNTVSNEEWLELLIRAGDEPCIDGVEMPGFPPLDFQKNSVGSRGPGDLKYEPLYFTNHVRKCAEQFGISINAETRLLDFGTGWGRMIRFFFKDILSENIFGIDTWDLMIDYCMKLLHAGNYSVNAPLPPTDFSDNSFDIIMSYSVFSHLRSDAAEKWIKEFSRLLKPGGILIATTEGLRFLNLIQEIKENPEKEEEHPWYKSLAKHFSLSIEEYRRIHAQGEFIYVPSGGGDALDSSFYGDAIVPEKYIRDVFGEYLKLVDFEDREKMGQAIFVMKKNPK